MNQNELNCFIKEAIFNAPSCPDGSRGMACPSCMAEFIADRLVYVGHVELTDPRW